MPGTRRFRRGVYLLPTVFTIGNLFCGFYSLVLSVRGDFERAAILIIIAGVLDGLDGRIARLTGTTSAFGNEFDSLADLSSFGIAPAMLANQWALMSLGRLGWLVAFLFVVCAAMRLARFNIQAASADRRYFAGLPSPSSAGALASLVFAFPSARPAGSLAVGVGLLVATLGLLMISHFRYRSFKDLGLGSRRSYLYVLPLAALLVAIAFQPQWTFLTFAAVYLASAPAGYLVSLTRRSRARYVAARRRRAGTDVADEPALR